MSKIILDKLKLIEQINKDEKEDISVTSTDSSSSDRKGEYITKSSEVSRDLSREEIISTLLSHESDYREESYHIAKVWARKLSKLDRGQRLFAEKAVHDVLFEAQLGKLHESSVKINRYCKHSRGLPSSPSQSTVTSGSSNNNSAALSASATEQNEPTNTNLSSEVIISESFPNENENLISSESQVDDITYTKSFTSANNRNQTYIVAASPSSLRKEVMSIRSRQPSLNLNQSEASVDSNGMPAANVATNTPNCILTQLSTSTDSCKNIAIAMAADIAETVARTGI